MVAAEDADNMGGITLYLMLRMRRHGGGCSPFGKYAAFYHLERIFLQKWAVLLFLRPAYSPLGTALAFICLEKRGEKGVFLHPANG